MGDSVIARVAPDPVQDVLIEGFTWLEYRNLTPATQRFCHICITRRKSDIATVRQQSMESGTKDGEIRGFAKHSPLRNLARFQSSTRRPGRHCKNEVCDRAVLRVVIGKVTSADPDDSLSPPNVRSAAMGIGCVVGRKFDRLRTWMRYSAASTNPRIQWEPLS